VVNPRENVISGENSFLNNLPISEDEKKTVG